MKDDIREYIADITLEDYTREELEEMLNDDLWVEDSVTGNGSGSYTFDRKEAMENLLGDSESENYIRELISEYGLDADTIAKHFLDWEYWDVSIRCYLLGQAIAEVLDDISQENLKN